MKEGKKQAKACRQARGDCENEYQVSIRQEGKEGRRKEGEEEEGEKKAQGIQGQRAGKGKGKGK